MKSITTLLLGVLTLLQMTGQQTDTLRFFSTAFQTERTIYIQTPSSFKYQDGNIPLPVFYILDGQHDWFVNPVVNTIKSLQLTYEIPQAILVIIPHQDRNKECAIKDISVEAPLLSFLTREVEEKLTAYHPGLFRLLVGHSYSASFALYARLKKPDFFTGILAHTPLDNLEKMVSQFERQPASQRSGICISVGSPDSSKDYYHRRNYDRLKVKYPEFFKSITVYEADFSTHNAVPIVATPYFLTRMFVPFSKRYTGIAKAGMDYKLLTPPGDAAAEIRKIESSSYLLRFPYPPEISDINGLASRYWGSDFIPQTIAVFEKGLQYYPRYYEFHLSLYELLLPTDPARAYPHLARARELLLLTEPDSMERQQILRDIDAAMKEKIPG